jgi:hypothetical protein
MKVESEINVDYEAFLAAANEIAAERGQFAMFVLVLREAMAGVMSTSASDSSAPMRWDVLLSAPWLAADRRAPLEYVAAKIEKHGGKAALRSIARLNAVPTSHPLVKRVQEELREPRQFEAPAGILSTGGIHLIDPSLIGPGVTRAIVVTATRNPKSRR